VLELATAMPSPDAECLIFGYGSFSYETSAVTTNILHYGRVRLIDHAECEDIIGRVMCPAEDSGQFCAIGENGVDACNGNLFSLLSPIN